MLIKNITEKNEICTEVRTVEDYHKKFLVKERKYAKARSGVCNFRVVRILLGSYEIEDTKKRIEKG